LLQQTSNYIHSHALAFHLLLLDSLALVSQVTHDAAFQTLFTQHSASKKQLSTKVNEPASPEAALEKAKQNRKQKAEGSHSHSSSSQ